MIPLNHSGNILLMPELLKQLNLDIKCHVLDTIYNMEEELKMQESRVFWLICQKMNGW